LSSTQTIGLEIIRGGEVLKNNSFEILDKGTNDNVGVEENMGKACGRGCSG